MNAIPPSGPTRGAVILFIAAIVTTVLFVAAGTWYAVYTANHDRTAVIKQVTASCDFWKQLGEAPLAPAPPLKAPSRFGVEIVLSSVKAYDGYSCGTLKPSAGLTQWARYYHLPLP